MEKKSCQKLFKCTKCSKEFTKKPDLVNHVTLIHGKVTPVVNSVGQEKTNKAIHGMFITSAKPPKSRVSVQGVESLWSDCRFILADWGS